MSSELFLIFFCAACNKVGSIDGLISVNSEDIGFTKLRTSEPPLNCFAIVLFKNEKVMTSLYPLLASVLDAKKVWRCFVLIAGLAM